MKIATFLCLVSFTIGSGHALEAPQGEQARPVRPRDNDGAPPPPQGMQERPGHRRILDAWRQADADGDGLLSLDEFGGMERPRRLPEEKRAQIFKRLDKNGDGLIGPAEMPKRPEGGMPPLARVDGNKDGRIEFEEFCQLDYVKRLPVEKQRMMFQRMDRDGDGRLTPRDRPAGGGEKPWKRDGEGRGGREPKGAGPRGLEFLRQLDRDGDGALGFEEFRQAPFLAGASEDEQEDRFEQMDRNGDLKIDPADFPPPGSVMPEGARD